MTKLWTFIRHNSGIFIGLSACLLLILYAYSCQSQVISIVNPQLKVSRTELVAEVDSFLTAAAGKFDDLDRQDLVKSTIFNSIIDLAQGGTINPIGVALTLAGILGIGASVDNVRKRTHINTLKGENLNVKITETVQKILKPKNN